MMETSLYYYDKIKLSNNLIIVIENL